MEDVRDTVPDDTGLSAEELGGRDGVREVGREGADESAVGTRSNSSPSNTERMVPPSSLLAVVRGAVGDSLLVLRGSCRRFCRSCVVRLALLSKRPRINNPLLIRDTVGSGSGKSTPARDGAACCVAARVQ